MAARLHFEPDVMDDAATRLDHGASENHTILAAMSLDASNIDTMPAHWYASYVEPGLSQVRANAADRRRALREMGNFIRARSASPSSPRFRDRTASRT